jgi:non-ribosomal peptide synthetase component E (peptide arylation enzyme)
LPTRSALFRCVLRSRRCPASQLADLLDGARARDADKLAACGAQRFSYAELDDMADRPAASFAAAAWPALSPRYARTASS